MQVGQTSTDYYTDIYISNKNNHMHIHEAADCYFILLWVSQGHAYIMLNVIFHFTYSCIKQETEFGNGSVQRFWVLDICYQYLFLNTKAYFSIVLL